MPPALTNCKLVQVACKLCSACACLSLLQTQVLGNTALSIESTDDQSYFTAPLQQDAAGTLRMQAT